MLIQIKKIKEVDYRDDRGNTVKDPRGTGENLKETQELEECIDVWAIKSCRPFHKNAETEKHSTVEGPVTVVYLHSSDNKRSPELHIQADFEQFSLEVNKLRDGNYPKTQI